MSYESYKIPRTAKGDLAAFGSSDEKQLEPPLSLPDPVVVEVEVEPVAARSGPAESNVRILSGICLALGIPCPRDSDSASVTTFVEILLDEPQLPS